jgi:transcriptional regulator with XRE-family HTH domain
MKREQILARLLRAVSGKSQRQVAEELAVDPSVVAQVELGEIAPGADLLRGLARSAGLSLAAGEELLDRYQALSRRRRRWGRSAGAHFDRMAAELRAQAEGAYGRFLALPLAAPPPRAEDRGRAEELFRRLEGLEPETRLVVVRVAEEFQGWALSERVCAASVEALSGDLDAAAAWAGLGAEVAGRVRAPEGFRRRLQGYAAAHVANVLRVGGDLQAADASLAQAKSLWLSGSDPDHLLDPGRLLDLEASLRRAQRRLPESLALLDEAATVSHHPERVLIKKGFTLEVMGEHRRAVETLRGALPLVERAGDPRLLYMANFNLAVSLCELGRFGEAEALLPQVRRLVAQLGDEIFKSRVTWLEGRISAGLGRRGEALALLAEARRGFAERGMSYDVALALLEEAVLHLEDGRSAEVKALAAELAQVFASKGVHREALAALRLFAEAAEREQATADLARRVLHFLTRARHDEGLRFAA